MHVTDTRAATRPTRRRLHRQGRRLIKAAVMEHAALELIPPSNIPTFTRMPVTVMETAEATPTSHEALQAQGATYITRRRLFHNKRSSVWLAHELVPCPARGEGVWAVSRQVVIKESIMAVIEAQGSEDAMGELAALLHLSQPGHRNVIRLLNFFQSEGGHRLFVVQPYVEGGDLLDYFNTTCRGQGLPEPQAQALLRQAVKGLLYLKRHQISHGDLSPENLALDGGGNVVLLDLGMCRVVPPCLALLPPTRFRGKHAYAPLETYKGQQCFDPWAADVFSLGATLFVLLCGEKFWAVPLPFRPSHLQARISHASSRRRQEPLSTHARHLLEAMLHPEPGRRPTLHAILEHAWLQDPESQAEGLQVQGSDSDSGSGAE